MRLESALSLKRQLVSEVLDPLAAQGARVRALGARALADSTATLGIDARSLESVPRQLPTFALGVAAHGKQYRLAIRLQRAGLRDSAVIERVVAAAKGEADVRLIGRVDKRARQPAGAVPWYQNDTRPLLIGASVAHFAVTAGTIGAFVRRAGKTYLLSNNHVLANEGRASSGDAILQRAPYDGGRRPAAQVGGLGPFVSLKPRAANLLDAALALLGNQNRSAIDATRLRGLVAGKDRKLAGLGVAEVDEGITVHKTGRTTGPTTGRVTAFDIDNLVVTYDVGNLRFDGQLEIEGSRAASFSDGGDSGSLIVDAGMRAVALLFAGSDSGGSNGAGLTFANPIHRVLTDLKATLLL